MNKRVLSFLLCLSLLFSVFSFSVSAAGGGPDETSFDMWSWLIRQAADDDFTACSVIDAIASKLGFETSISDHVYKLYGAISDSVCAKSSDGYHVAEPSSISIAYESQSLADIPVDSYCIYTAQCSLCGKAFSSNSQRLASAYSDYLADQDFSGQSVNLISGQSGYTWTPRPEDLAAIRYSFGGQSYYLKFWRSSSNGSDTFLASSSYSLSSNTVLTGSFQNYNPYQNDFYKAIFTEDGLLLSIFDSSGNFTGYTPYASDFAFTFPFSATYTLIKSSPYIYYSGTIKNSSSSYAEIPLTYTGTWSTQDYNRDKVAGDTGWLSAPGSNLPSVISTTTNSVWGVISSSTYVVDNYATLFKFPTFLVTNAIGGGSTVVNNISNIDNSVIYNNYYTSPSGTQYSITSYWYSGSNYHVTYDDNGESQEVDIYFNTDGIYTVNGDSITKTEYTGPVLAPSIDGLETNSWLERIYNRLGELMDLQAAEDVGSDGISLLRTLRAFLLSLVVFIVGGILTITEGVLSLGHIFSHSADGFYSGFNEVIQLE